jgi:AhpD family alkylhydroperoxidase
MSTRGFGKRRDAAFANGALDQKTKELMALGMGSRNGCIAHHAKAAAKPRAGGVSIDRLGSDLLPLDPEKAGEEGYAMDAGRRCS